MKILYLGPESPLIAYLESQGDLVISTSDKIDEEFVKKSRATFIVSYNYRYLLKKDILEYFIPNRAINLHVSLLPWNRGADPNFWSFAQNTPKGVTIHYMDEGLDTGDIIVQKPVIFSEEETLKSSYNKLQETMRELFIKNWPRIKNGEFQRIKQASPSSYHKLRDKEPYLYLLDSGWDTPVKRIVGCALTQKENGKNV